MNRGDENRGQLETRGRAEKIYSVDSIADGISFGHQPVRIGTEVQPYPELQLPDMASAPVPLRTRYLLQKANPLHELEANLMRLSRQGILRRSHVILGVESDPFHPFEGRFDATMKFLALFQRYTPGHLTVQTRSALCVIALPVFAKLGAGASVTIGIETPTQEVADRYTPSLPRVADRLRAAETLRRAGIEVTIQVAPVLPYGDWRKDAESFAALLIDHADYISVNTFESGGNERSRRVRGSPLAQLLANDRKFHWLRRDSARPLLDAIQARAAHKLQRPVRDLAAGRQLSMFGT